MQQNYTKLSLTTFILLTLYFFSGCSKSGSPTPKNTTPTLAVTSLSVSAGPFNTSVVITGTGFSGTAANYQVFFNGKAATVTAATTTQLTVMVPLGASTGNVTISVNNGKVINGPVFTYQLSAVVSTFAGSGQSGWINGLASVASFSIPWGLVFDGGGNLYVSDGGKFIRKISPAGLVSIFAGGGSGTLDGKGTNATFENPTGMAIDVQGNLYVADGVLVRKITPDGTVSTIFAKGGDITAVAVDAAGNVYAADEKNDVILKISPGGIASIFAGNETAGKADGKGTLASFNGPIGITIDAAGNLYVVDGLSNLIRKITPGGFVSTIAGNGSNGSANGQGANASFNNSTGIAVDGAGNLYIGDFGNNTIRKITPDGTVSTLAGNGVAGFANGQGIAASFASPQGVTLDASGNIYVADSENNMIRKIIMQ